MTVVSPEREGRPAQPAAQRLAEDSAALVRAEVEQLRADLGAILRRSSVGLVMTAVAGVGGLLALHAAATGLLRFTDRLLPPRASAAVLTVGYLAGSAALGVAGARRLRAAGLLARDAADDLRTDVRSATGSPGT